jgi:uncharacterized UPF0160 family protein
MSNQSNNTETAEPTAENGKSHAGAQLLRVVTHDGAFHADDVFAIATIILAHPFPEGPVSVNVVRSRKPAVLDKADILVDVGKTCRSCERRL